MNTKLFVAELCNTVWKLLLTVFFVSILYAWITDTFIESDKMFAVYYLVVNSAFLVADLVMRKLANGK